MNAFSTDDTVKPTRQRMRRARAQGYDELVETSPGGVTRKSGAIRAWTPLENCFRNGRLSAEQYQAGQKFFCDWYLGEGHKAASMQWSEYISGSATASELDAAERRVFHSRRFAQANALLDELGLRKPLHWFIINDIPAETVGREFWGYRKRHSASGSGVTALSIGLQRLAKFYGLTGPAPRPTPES